MNKKWHSVHWAITKETHNALRVFKTTQHTAQYLYCVLIMLTPDKLLSAHLNHIHLVVCMYTTMILIPYHRYVDMSNIMLSLYYIAACGINIMTVLHDARHHKDWLTQVDLFEEKYRLEIVNPQTVCQWRVVIFCGSEMETCGTNSLPFKNPLILSWLWWCWVWTAIQNR